MKQQNLLDTNDCLVSQLCKEEEKNLSTALIIFANLIIAIMLYGTVVFGYLHIAETIDLQKKRTDFLERVKQGETKRIHEEQARNEIEGKTDEKNFMLEFDRTITQSGLKAIFPALTSELFLGIMIISSCILGLLGIIVTGIFHLNMMIGLIVGIGLGICIFYFVLNGMKRSNYKKTEKEILSFVNLVENYSKTSDDIISIFGKITPYVAEPLKSALDDCYAEARSTGDTEQALLHLQYKVEHEKFRETIRNIEIASRHQADYAAVIKDQRAVIAEYLRNEREKAAIIRSGRIEIVILFLLGVFLLFLLFRDNSGFGVSMDQLFGLSLKNGVMSLVCTIYWIVTGFVTAKTLYRGE